MDTVHECDGQTDRRTDGQTDRITITKTVQRIASHGKNVQNYKYDAFLMGKDSISWTERVFCSIIIDFI